MNENTHFSMNRRGFIVAAAASLTLPKLTGCVAHGPGGYDEAIAHQRATLASHPDMREMIRYATLAPSGHNTQPWRFAMRAKGISLTPDLARRTPIVDPDDHHLFVSLGCAAENFLVAAEANGHPGVLAFRNDPDRVDIELATGPAKPSPLYQAIPHRQSTRSVYDGRPVPIECLRILDTAAKMSGVSVLFLSQVAKRDELLDYILKGNTAQMRTPAFVDELKQWVRFNDTQAVGTGDGLFSKCSGQSTVPTWLGERLFSTFFKEDEENAKYAKQLRSSAGVAVFVGDKPDKEHWVRVGQSFQRFALQATALGIRYAMLNQPVEVPSIRADFAAWLGMKGLRPDLVVRFGNAPAMPMSLRRSVQDVWASSA